MSIQKPNTITPHLNFPLNVNAIHDLFDDKADLELSMSPRLLPFSQKLWEEKMSPTQGTLSFFVLKNGKTVGHFAFVRITKDNAAIGYVFLKKSERGKGTSVQMMKLAEKLATNLWNHKHLLLKVRATNTPAFKLYKKMGYKECGREGDIIEMKKPLKRL